MGLNALIVEHSGLIKKYKMKKRIKQRKGFLNRHIDGMPKKKSNIKILYEDIDGDMILDCIWEPDNDDVAILGIIKDSNSGSEFEISKKNNHKFIYYKLIN